MAVPLALAFPLATGLWLDAPKRGMLYRNGEVEAVMSRDIDALIGVAINTCWRERISATTPGILGRTRDAIVYGRSRVGIATVCRTPCPRKLESDRW